jgi:chitodextrinase
MKTTISLKQALILTGAALATAAFAASASLVFAAADTTPPTAPTALTATPVSVSQINLSWTASTDNVGVAGYGVFRNGLQVATTSATSYSDTGLSAGTSYSYTVDAFDAAGNLSTQSAAASTSTLTETTPPSVPTGLIATPVSATQVNLSWSASTDAAGVAGYDVYRNGALAGTTAATSYSDSGLAASTAYSYTVAAYDAAGNTSGQSGSVSATTLASGSTTTTATSTYTVPPTVDIGSNGNILIHGMTVTGIGTNTFTGTIWGITYTVNYSGTATAGNNGRGRFEFLLRGGNSAAASASQIQVGDEVGVQGTVTSGAPLVITAQVVRNYSIMTPRVQNPIFNGGASSTTGNNGYNLGGIQSLLQQLLNRFRNLQGQFGDHR